ncbi:MAG: NAD(+) diphosphatase [Armatimonadetes bacterium]|nr:NAD(+) diphosphatase [Armatimonadota bacterium]
MFLRAYPAGKPAVLSASLQIHLPFVAEGELLVHHDRHGARLLRSATPAPENALYIGDLDGVPCLAFSQPLPADDDAVEPENVKRLGLRSLFGHMSDEEITVAGYASQLIRWHKNARFCPACGGPTHNDDGWNQKCMACGFSHYPPATPAVLILVHDGAGNILLAQKEGWGKRYSILAGFVEPGESLEDCCRRETIEEVQVTVGECTYDGSQTWPFPHQLMVGFLCRYDSGTITPDPTELSHAAWFHHTNLPELPPPYALSRQLIDRWVKNCEK